MIAKTVLNDCKIALEELKKAIESKQKDIVRIRWFTCLALLRSVGHVLNQADNKNLNKIQKAKAKDLYNKLQSDSIFKEFIKEERDLILKEYKSLVKMVHEEENFSLLKENGDKLLTENGFSLLGSSLIETEKKFQGIKPIVLQS